jgi:uncharacterized protein (DUF305 family)
MNNKITFGIGGVVVGLVLASVFGGTIFSGYNKGNGEMMSNNSQNTGNSQMMGNIDQHFIEQMIPHHEGAIAMANLALEKATHPEIKTLAEAILRAQTAENQDMRVWYQDWFGKSVPEGASSMMGGMMSQSGMHMGSTQDIDALKNASDFDKEFIEQMIPHHQMAIMMARMLEDGTSRSEMLELADNIETSQAREIQQMQEWYKNWYK